MERRTVMYQGSGRGAAAVGTGCNAISLASSSDGRSSIEDELNREAQISTLQYWTAWGQDRVEPFLLSTHPPGKSGK